MLKEHDFHGLTIFIAELKCVSKYSDWQGLKISAKNRLEN